MVSKERERERERESTYQPQTVAGAAVQLSALDLAQRLGSENAATACRAGDIAAVEVERAAFHLDAVSLLRR